MQIALVISEFAEKSGIAIARLQKTCIARLRELGVSAPEIFAVPGAFEIPVAVKQILETKKFDAVIALGAVVRGETTHYELVSENCARKLADLGVEFGAPVIFGVLTVENTAQAETRAEKGSEFADAAVKMVRLLERIKP